MSGHAPHRDPVRVDAEVVASSGEGAGSRRLLLRVPGWPGFQPGQFVMLSPGPLEAVPRSDPLLPRPMAVYRERVAAGPPGGEPLLEILYKRSGRGTALLAASRPGQRIRLVGPLGRGFALPGAGEPALLVGGGTGIASLYELAAQALRAGARVEVLLGARSAGDLMGVADFEALGAPLRVATEDGSRGAGGLVTELLETALAGASGARVYACGPTAMMRRCAELAAAAGVACWASLENVMACGFGVCLGCAVPVRAGGYALVCREGPMFEASGLDWGAIP